MRIILLIFLLLINYSLFAQPYSVGHTIINLEDTSRDNRLIPIQVYYPSDSAGMDVPFIDMENKGCPWIIFTHGYHLKPKAYKNIFNTLVPIGYIVVMPATGTGLLPSHSELARDIIFLAKHLKNYTTQYKGPLHNRFDSTFCIMGHSMGGGCSCVAAAQLPEANTLVTLAAYDTNPSAISAAGEIQIPSLMISGSKDKITRPGKHQLPIFENIPAEKKIWINILGGSHCQMLSRNGFCRTGEIMLLNNPSISRDKQLEILNKYLVPWLDFTLRNDKDAGLLFINNLKKDGEIEYKSGNYRIIN